MWCWYPRPDLGGIKAWEAHASPWQCCAAHGCFVWLSVTAAAVTALQGPQLWSEGLGDDCCECSWRQGPDDFYRNVVMSLHKVACKESIARGCTGHQPWISHFPVQRPVSLTTPWRCKEAFLAASPELCKPLKNIQKPLVAFLAHMCVDPCVRNTSAGFPAHLDASREPVPSQVTAVPWLTL